MDNPLVPQINKTDNTDGIPLASDTNIQKLQVMQNAALTGSVFFLFHLFGPLYSCTYVSSDVRRPRQSLLADTSPLHLTFYSFPNFHLSTVKTVIDVLTHD